MYAKTPYGEIFVQKIYTLENPYTEKKVLWQKLITAIC